MKVVLFGRGGKVGSVLAPALEAAGHELVELDQAEAMVDFTAPDAVEANVRAALEQGVPCVVGTSGWDPAPLGALAAERGLPLLVVPNFALGAVLMMRLAAEAARHLPRAEIVELHGEAQEGRAVGNRQGDGGGARRGAGALGPPARAWSRTRRCSSAARASC